MDESAEKAVYLHQAMQRWRYFTL